MKKLISYLGIYIFLHGMYLMQGCCSSKTCESVSAIESYYQSNFVDSVSAGDTAVFNKLALIVTPTIYGAQCMKPNTWISSAYAFSCNNEYYAMTTLQKMTITATQDYDAVHPSGADLTDLFEIHKRYGPYYDTDGLAYSYYLSFKTPPDNDMLLNIKVQFYYEHFDDPFESTLPSIYLKK